MFLLQLDQCRAALSANEEIRDQLKRDMMDAERLRNQTLDTVETYRREVSELRRSLADVARERDSLSHSNSLLRETLRGGESERIR